MGTPVVDKATEIIDGDNLIEILQGLSNSRRLCRMEISGKGYAWFTLLLGIREEKGSKYLLIDKVTGFENVLSQSTKQVIVFEFLEKDGVRSYFKAHVTHCYDSEIQAELHISPDIFGGDQHIIYPKNLTKSHVIPFSDIEKTAFI